MRKDAVENIDYVIKFQLQGISVCSNAAGEYENENENEDEYLLFWWGASLLLLFWWRASLYTVTLRASRCTCRDVASSRMNGKQRKCVQSRRVPAHRPFVTRVVD